ncbi:hypothetical protein E2C01_077414 [Portunus trituberculatus]|uniref:Uncharacterized protein n=1 Tax=Portunus trituberculatus TaxID=210409 RepID=A0A5B7IG09_PORTR|nr:hypothetical protein [Portunus trituberculatus]
MEDLVISCVSTTAVPSTSRLYSPHQELLPRVMEKVVLVVLLSLSIYLSLLSITFHCCSFPPKVLPIAGCTWHDGNTGVHLEVLVEKVLPQKLIPTHSQPRPAGGDSDKNKLV